MALQAGLPPLDFGPLAVPWKACLHCRHSCRGGPQLRAADGDVPARYRAVPAMRRFQCSMNALVLVGGSARLPLANSARMPSTAEEVCAEIRSAFLRAAADLRWGFDCLSVMLRMVRA